MDAEVALARLRFGLRSLLLAVTVVAVILAPIAWWYHATAQRLHSVDRLQAVGARVFYDHQLARADGRIAEVDDAPEPNTLLVRYAGVGRACDVAGVWCPRYFDDHGNIDYEMGDADIRLLEPLNGTRFLLIDSQRLSDGGARVLESLSDLEDVGLNSPQISDATAYRLSRLTKLTAVSLNDTGITDKGVRFLARLPKLKVLNLSHTRVTSDSLLSIGSMHNLVELHLRGNIIGPGHLKSLKGLKSLTTLDVRDTGVSKADVDELSAALPDLAIYR